MKLLHIDSSILGANSASRSVAAAVVDRLRQAAPDLDVTYRDLAAAPLPHLSLANLPTDHPIAAASLASDAPAVQQDRSASQAVLDEFLAADIVVVGTPMYNFTIPGQLKAWVDRILIPGKTFRYGAAGVEGLAGAKRVIIAISRGGLYGVGTPAASAEHAEAYLRAVFGFIAITDLEFVVAEGLQMGSEQRQQALDAALHTVRALKAA
jgi:FMN-dependent NADH-azoreductase